MASSHPIWRGAGKRTGSIPFEHQCTRSATLPRVDSSSVGYGTPVNSQVFAGKDELSSFCHANGIRRLAIFGSALRDDFGPESDIDVLVEFQADRIPGLLGLAGMELELSKLFRGRRVDLRTLEDLSPYFRQEVLATAEVQYAQG